jgi:hypothetical protein
VNREMAALAIPELKTNRKGPVVLNLVTHEETKTNTITTTNHAVTTSTEGWEREGAGDSTQTLTLGFFF